MGDEHPRDACARARGFGPRTAIGQLEKARKAATQRAQLYDIIRNDVFEMQKHEREAVQRLDRRGANADQIQTFEQRSERVSTPAQLAGLERELFP